ncbi:hypothetical protein BH686_30020 [Rhodococcus erythropolis]|nr:hypothetical protein BH686_30020 [Rhodococcus erythropolis]
MLGHFGVHSLRCQLVLIDRPKPRALTIREAELHITLVSDVPAPFARSCAAEERAAMDAALKWDRVDSFKEWGRR